MSKWKRVRFWPLTYYIQNKQALRHERVIFRTRRVELLTTQIYNINQICHYRTIWRKITCLFSHLFSFLLYPYINYPTLAFSTRRKQCWSHFYNHCPFVYETLWKRHFFPYSGIEMSLLCQCLFKMKLENSFYSYLLICCHCTCEAINFFFCYVILSCLWSLSE